MGKGLERVILGLPIRATTSAKDIILRRRNTLIQVQKHSFRRLDALLQHSTHLHSMLVTKHCRTYNFFWFISSICLGPRLAFPEITEQLEAMTLVCDLSGIEAVDMMFTITQQGDFAADYRHCQYKRLQLPGVVSFRTTSGIKIFVWRALSLSTGKIFALTCNYSIIFWINSSTKIVATKGAHPLPCACHMLHLPQTLPEQPFYWSCFQSKLHPALMISLLAAHSCFSPQIGQAINTSHMGLLNSCRILRKRSTRKTSTYKQSQIWAADQHLDQEPVDDLPDGLENQDLRITNMAVWSQLDMRVLHGWKAL